MDFRSYPHIRALYESMSPHICIQGSVQCFKSEWMIIDHFAMAFNGLSVFYVLAKYDVRNTYVQNRINRCVQNVKEYKRIVDKGFFDNVALKSFGRGVVKYVGSNVLADFKEFPADCLYTDEEDDCNADNLGYGLDRLRASKYQFTRSIGNPRHSGQGINGRFADSSAEEWCGPCNRCRDLAPLDWFVGVAKEVTNREGDVVDYLLRDGAWEPGCRRDVRIMCPACDGGALARDSMDGLWVPSQPGHPIEGKHISMLCCTINDVAGMWTRFRAGLTDPGKLQRFYNSDLGLPYTAVGHKVTVSLLDACAEDDYTLVIEAGCAHVRGDRHDGPCSMGVDVGNNFDARVSFPGKRGTRRMVFCGKVQHVEDLLDLIDRYNVEKVVVDSQPETTMVEEFQERAPCDVWLCRYPGTEGSDRKLTYDLSARRISVDRTSALDRSFAQLRRRKNILPANYAVMPNYVSEMCGPVREVVEDGRGNPKYEWSKCTDHARHADVYDMFAAELLQEAVLDEVFVG